MTSIETLSLKLIGGNVTSTKLLSPSWIFTEISLGSILSSTSFVLFMNALIFSSVRVEFENSSNEITLEPVS